MLYRTHSALLFRLTLQVIVHIRLNRLSFANWALPPRSAQLNSQWTAPELTTYCHHSHANVVKCRLGAHANLLLLLPSSEEDSVSIVNGRRAVRRNVKGTGWHKSIFTQCVRWGFCLTAVDSESLEVFMARSRKKWNLCRELGVGCFSGECYKVRSRRRTAVLIWCLSTARLLQNGHAARLFMCMCMCLFELI